MARKPKKPPITLDGLDELRAGIKALMGAMDDKEVAGICLEGAKVYKTAVKRRAPKGQTGNLKKAVRAKKTKRYRPHNPSAWAGIDRKKAPHAHLVENGHALVRNGRVVGNVPPHPFFRPAVQETNGQVRTVVIKGLSRGIDAVKRRRRKVVRKK